MKPSRITIPTDLGYPLTGYFFSSENSKCFLLILPGMAIRQQFYFHLANFLQNHSYNVITFDYCGIGESSYDLSDDRIKFHHWGTNDINSVIKYVQHHFSASCIRVIAHSAGGQLFGFAKLSTMVNRVIFISAGIGYWKLYAFPRNLWIFFGWYVMLPLMLRLRGYFPRFLFKVPVGKGIASQWIKWGRKSDYLMGDSSITKLLENYNKITCKITLIGFSDDTWVSKYSMEKISSFYPNSDFMFLFFHPSELQYQSIGHFGIFSNKKRAFWKKILFLLNN